MKETIGIIAVILTFLGYIPYIRDTIKGKTTPHVYTWFIWGLVTAIAFGLQISAKAGPGAFTTLAAAIVCFIIFGFGLRQGEKNITTTDTIFFILSFIALGLWLFAKQPVLSVILVSTIDMLGFVPTIRKSWHKPHEETLISYQTNTLRFALAIIALSHYTIVTALYPITWVVANGLFSIFLILRRGKVGSSIGWQG
jgi:uncharacterized protein with PQ loop repeat